MRELAELEAVVGQGQMTFVAVGQALQEIRARRLYREQGYDSFDQYCLVRWGWAQPISDSSAQPARVTAAVRPIHPTSQYWRRRRRAALGMAAGRPQQTRWRRETLLWGALTALVTGLGLWSLSNAAGDDSDTPDGSSSASDALDWQVDAP